MQMGMPSEGARLWILMFLFYHPCGQGSLFLGWQTSEIVEFAIALLGA
jgi:hypothetical protein